MGRAVDGQARAQRTGDVAGLALSVADRVAADAVGAGPAGALVPRGTGLAVDLLWLAGTRAAPVARDALQVTGAGGEAGGGAADVGGPGLGLDRRAGASSVAAGGERGGAAATARAPAGGGARGVV